MRMILVISAVFAAALLASPVASPSGGEGTQRVVDVPTRPGVIQRFLFLSPREPKATVVLFAGGHGGLQIAADGRFGWGAGNFLVRSHQLFVERDLAVAIVDAPSDRQGIRLRPYLSDFRQTPEHVADIRTVIAWLREHVPTPVWLIGTSRGTESAAYVAGTPGTRPKGTSRFEGLPHDSLPAMPELLAALEPSCRSIAGAVTSMAGSRTGTCGWRVTAGRRLCIRLSRPSRTSAG